MLFALLLLSTRVPEPVTFVLLASGIGALLVTKKKR
jgi:hypothetical protein